MRGEWLVFFGGLMWSTGGVGVKFLDMSPLAIASLRSIVCGLFFLVLSRGSVKSPVGWKPVAAGAVLYALVVGTFVLATKWTTAANAILFQYTAPLWVALLGAPVLGERIRPRDMVALVLGGIGVIICVSSGFHLSLSDGLSRAVLGDIVGIFSGIVFGGLMLVVRHAARDAETATATNFAIIVWGNLLMAVCGSPWAFAEVQAGHVTLPSVGILLWLGVGQLGLGYYLFQRGMQTTPALRASVISFVEPVLNPLWVALAFHERPATETLIGAPLVLAAVLWTALKGSEDSGS